MLVRGVDEREDRRERVGEVQLRHGDVVGLDRAVRGRVEVALGIAFARGTRHDPLAVRLDHLQRPRDEIAEPIREIGVESSIELLWADRRVLDLLERRVAQHEIPDRVTAPLVRSGDRIDHVAARARQPAPTHREEAVGEHLARQLDPRGHQHRRPDDAVEAGDVLADDVDIAGPPFLEFRLVRAEPDAGHVVDERVEPDVDDVFGVIRELDAPREVAPRDADVLEPSFQPPEHLVATGLRDAEFRVLAIELFELRLVLRQPEEEVLLLELLDVLGMGRVDRAASVDELVLVLERLAAEAVQALVRGEVDVVVGDPAPDELLDALHVVGVGRPDETVVRDLPRVGHLSELGGVLVDERPRRDALGLRRDVVPRRVLIRACEEEDVVATLPVETGEHIRARLLVAVMEPRHEVDVVDRGRDVELSARHLGILGRT